MEMRALITALSFDAYGTEQENVFSQRLSQFIS